MNFNIIFISSHSITIELDNNNPYYSLKPYNVLINNLIYKENVTTNIVTLFGLESNTLYNVEIEGTIKEVTTKFEYVTLNVLKFGAKGDGITNNTNFIQACILACPPNGRVYIPKGNYMTGPLFLKSDITIELAKDCHLIGLTDRKLYPILPGMTMLTDESDDYNLGSWEGNPLDCFASIITGINVKNVNIIGEGIIDGNASNSDWWLNHHNKVIAWRPRGVFLNHCENINFVGVMVCNTPSWNLHPYFSKQISFIDMRLISPKDSPNTDGCDPESCDGVDILGVHFSVGDDCIAIKAGKIYMGAKYKVPSSNFNIRNCSMNFGHGAVVLGSEMSGGIKNITVSRCFFNSTDRGLRIKTRRGRGSDAIIDGITFENIKMDNVLTPLVINMFYYCDPDGKTEYVYSKECLPVDERTPYLGKFHFKDIICDNVNIAAGTFYGLPEQPIKEIILENVNFKYALNPKEGIPAMMSFLEPMKGRGLIFSNVGNVSLSNVTFDGLKNEETELENVNSFTRK